MKELLPTPMIQGEKVWLRAMEKRDFEAFAEGRNDLEIGFVAGYFFPQSMIAIENWYEKLMSEQQGKDGFYFTICPLDSNEVVGFAWLWHLDYDHSNAEFSIFLSDTELKGKGLGTDALNAVLDFGFNNLPLERIYLLVRKMNKRAIHSYEKMGMVGEGTLRKAWRFKGKLVEAFQPQPGYFQKGDRHGENFSSYYTRPRTPNKSSAWFSCSEGSHR
jgi:RimJ/RimL family protein N-acetyltransferase